MEDDAKRVRDYLILISRWPYRDLKALSIVKVYACEGFPFSAVRFVGSYKQKVGFVVACWIPAERRNNWK